MSKVRQREKHHPPPRWQATDSVPHLCGSEGNKSEIQVLCRLYRPPTFPHFPHFALFSHISPTFWQFLPHSYIFDKISLTLSLFCDRSSVWSINLHQFIPQCLIFSIHCFFAKQKSKRMVRNGGELGAGVGRFEDVRCHVSGVTCQVSGVTKEIMC